MNNDPYEWMRNLVKNVQLDSMPTGHRALNTALVNSDVDLQSLTKRPLSNAEAELFALYALSDDDSWELTQALIFHHLNNAITLHPLLSIIAAQMILQKRQKTERRPKQNGRDAIIIAALTILEQRFNLSPTKNPTSSALSGADVVSECLSERRLDITPDAVMKVWAKRRKE